MATSRGLTNALQSLSISPHCIRHITPRFFPVSHFSTTSVAFGGPISRARRERAHARARRAKARAEELRLHREARADPIIGHSTQFTNSLLRPREVLTSIGRASHTRSGEENWPLLTNFKIGSDDALTLAIGAKAAEKRRLDKGLLRMEDDSKWSATERVLFQDTEEAKGQNLQVLEEEDRLKREAMARLIDLTNANSRAVISANVESAVAHFGRFEGDTGSPEVQSIFPLQRMIDGVVGVMTVKILALKEHMQYNLQDKRSKRALNMLVHQRQKMLKYLRRKYPERYIDCLKEIGLDDSAVVREVTSISLKR